MDKYNRHSLTIRWQPTDGKPMAKIADWLNSLPIKERRKKVAEVCMMALLPYALEASQEEPEAIERCYWDAQNRLDQYGYVMKQALGIKSEPATTNVFKEKMFDDGQDISPVIETEVATKQKEADRKEMDFIFGL